MCYYSHMTTRASVPASGDVTRIVLLALLSQRPMHGYEVWRVLDERRMQHWADIQPPSIYAALQRLTKEGLVEEVGVTQEGKRPPRTTYRVTDAGREELRRLLRHAWSSPVRWAASVDVALSFYQHLPPDEVTHLLEERLAAIDAIEAETTDHKRGFLDTRASAPGFPPGVRVKVADIFEHQRLLLAAERAWTEQALEHARSGVYAVDEAAMRGYDRGAAQMAGHADHSREQSQGCASGAAPAQQIEHTASRAGDVEER